MAVAAATFIGVAGGSLITTLTSQAATSTSTPPAQVTRTAAETAASARPDHPPDHHRGGHIGPNGTKEELLTGDVADKATAAATKAVPKGTIERVETDAEGAQYEAHMTQSDGTHVTVKLNDDFSVKSVDTDRMHR